MNTLLQNIRASAILIKNLPSTLSGDALLISREEARRIGYELEACAERMEQKVPEGMAIVSVETLKDAERYAWIKAHVGEQPTSLSGRNEFSEHKTEYVFPKLISWADFCGPITLDEAIDFKLAAAKERGE